VNFSLSYPTKSAPVVQGTLSDMVTDIIELVRCAAVIGFENTAS